MRNNVFTQTVKDVLVLTILASGVISARATLNAQTSADPSTGVRDAARTFEVLTIKKCADDPLATRGGEGRFTPVAMFLNCHNVRGFVEMAYVLYANGAEMLDDPGVFLTTTIEGGPSWINSERYAIQATTATPTSEAMMQGPLLQTLLENRFKLKIRREVVQVPVYELTVAKNGPKLTPFREGTCLAPVVTVPETPPPPGKRYCARQSRPNGPNSTYFGEGMTMNEFAKTFLGGNPRLGLDRRIIDKTQLSGQFDIRIEYAPTRGRRGQSDGPVSEPTAASIFTALQEQLGLKLEPARGPGTRLIIESVERPSEN